MGDDVVIQQISFRGDDVVEIQYSEPNDQSDHVAIVKVLMFDSAAGLEAQTQELKTDIIDLIYMAIDKLRNPPLTRHSGRRNLEGG